uniref:Proline-rich protein 3 n=1 Tax=Patelloida mimula TaxID=351188 RepID=A0A8U0ATS9_9GAST|nr:proline-rich protein 3 [Patelloida mimula]
MNLLNSFPRFGVCILGINLLLCGFSEGFIGMEGMEELFPLLMFGGLGGQSNYVQQPPVIPRPLPATPPPPVFKPPNTITWRWVPNMRYVYPMFNPNWNQPAQSFYPWMNNVGMAKNAAGMNSIATNSIAGSKSDAALQGVIPGAPLGFNTGGMMPQPMMNNLAGGAGVAGGASNAVTSKMAWNTHTTSKGTTM